MRRNMRRMSGALAACGLGLCGVASAQSVPADGPPVHVPSPDWRDQVVYFAMIDRFADGDPGNNDQHAGEYDPADGAKFSGGDLRGLAARLDYIRGLGATALWITPPVANQWWNPRQRYGGYHGYWAADFGAVDAHFGALDDYRALSRALHGRGMYLVQDIVVNHTGDWFTSPDLRDPETPAKGFARHPDERGRRAPVQPPFDRNDALDPAQRHQAIYHWTPDITDYANPDQERNFQLAGLDDLDTENPRVRDALRDAYGRWIREVGVDGFRVDTAFYVPPSFFPDFLHGDDAAHPGIARVAASTGRRDFLSFGEGFAIDRAYEDTQARRIDAYMRVPGGLPSMIDFPLYGALGDVFARGAPTAVLGHRIAGRMRIHADPWRMPTFVDNHDVDRFLASGRETGLKHALLAMLTLPGIPVVYYGTEQGFTEPRASMFAGGFGSGGRDRFDTRAPLYRYLQRAIALRRAHKVFSRGVPTVLRDSAAGQGGIAYRMVHGQDVALVAFNTADVPVLLDALDTGLGAGRRLAGAFAIEGDAGDATTDADGRVSLVLPPHAGRVWLAGTKRAPVGAHRGALSIDPLPASRFAGDVAMRGRAARLDDAVLVVDGDLSRAQPIRADASGRWTATIDTADMVDPSVPHRVVAWSAGNGIASGAQSFFVDRAWISAADVADPPGDDRGPRGHYVVPEGWASHPMDLRGVRAWTSGGALKLELRMRALSRQWNPANGFDHVAFTVFVELPGRDGGATAMPLQNADLPGGMRWHYRLRIHGWSNALFSAEGAGPRHEGTPTGPAALIATDAARSTVTLTLPAAALGRARTLAGARVYVTTWDYDGGYRALQPQLREGAFGGGDGMRDPLVMDESSVVVLR